MVKFTVVGVAETAPRRTIRYKPNRNTWRYTLLNPTTCGEHAQSDNGFLFSTMSCGWSALPGSPINQQVMGSTNQAVIAGRSWTAVHVDKSTRDRVPPCFNGRVLY